MIPSNYRLIVHRLNTRANSTAFSGTNHQELRMTMNCISLMSDMIDARDDLIERLKRERDELAARLDREVMRVA